MISDFNYANITLPNFFSDNMVLQRNSEVTIWGWASPNEEITLKAGFLSQEYKTKANNQARWEIKITTSKEGGPYTITLKGYNEVVLKNIMLGEVWLCSGQSNMEMSASWGIENGEEEIKKANYPNIRFFIVPKLTATYPQDNLTGNWRECSPETMKYNSAIGYFFAQHLQEKMPNIPIGIITSAWGGSPAEIWIPENVINDDIILKEAAQKLSTNEYSPKEPARAFNAMIHPLINYKIAGVLWYQGESNVGSRVYDKTFSNLITSWRKLWNYDFPFYFVQIAPFGKTDETDRSSVIVRDLQRQVSNTVPNTAIVITSDISTIDDIHPKNKKSVGIRLSNLALKNIYKTNTDLVESPNFRKIEIKKEKIIVSFDYSEGLYFKNKRSSLFEIAGNDDVFYQAEASIQNNTVLVFCKMVKNPTQVRFAWKNTSQSDLFNKANLPASSFESK